MKILLVEDEQRLSEIIVKGLKKMSYAVDPVYDGATALEYMSINSYDLVILDLNLPVIPGLEVLKQIRNTDNATKILILSARSDVQDKIIGLDLGANDYLEKPFDFLELAARIRNLLRWSFVQKQSIITIGSVVIDTTLKAVTVDGSSINLTNKEYGILEYLALEQPRYVSAEELIEHVWHSEADLISNAIKYHIHSLKKKLGVDGLITNIRGRGYSINDKEDSR